MTAPRDPDRLISDFLDEGMNELPDRSYDAVRTALEQTRQRVVFGPWKEPTIMTATRFGIAAAIALVAVVGIRFLPTAPSGPGVRVHADGNGDLNALTSQLHRRSRDPLRPATAARLSPAGTYVTVRHICPRSSFTVPADGGQRGPTVRHVVDTTGEVQMLFTWSFSDSVYRRRLSCRTKAS